MSCIFTPRDFDGPSFSHPAFFCQPEWAGGTGVGPPVDLTCGIRSNPVNIMKKRGGSHEEPKQWFRTFESEFKVVYLVGYEVYALGMYNVHNEKDLQLLRE